MMKKSLFGLTAVSLCCFTACSENADNKTSEDKMTKNEVTTIDVSYMDTTVDPKVDFYAYSNGSWIKNNPVPEDESAYGSFNELSDENNQKLKTILEEAASSNAEKGSVDQLIGDYYTTFMDMEARNAAGIAPIQAYLDKIDQLSDKSELATLVGEHHNYGIGSFFGVGIEQDLKDNEKYAVYFAQRGTGLPSKDYYFEERHATTREKYHEHVMKMFGLIGHDEAKSTAAADFILAFETKLATHMMTPVEMRDISKLYNPFSMQDFLTLTPVIDWTAYMKAREIPAFEQCIVSQVNYMKELDAIIEETALEDIKTYLTWKLVDATAGALTEELDKQNFWFYGTILRGSEEMKPSWERSLSALQGSAIAECVGHAFVDRHFSPEAKVKVNEMVDNLMAAFEDRLETLDWMGAETKEMAKQKLASFGRKLGYPDKWTDYSSLSITRESYAKNYLEQRRFSVRKNVKKFGGPIDKDEWGMPPHMVNAYYNPLNNEIAFPAGIMQPPFFDPNAEDALNYGRMGMVIGHEFSHGFDDQGARFDAKGLLENWWTDQDSEEFAKRTTNLVNQFNDYSPLEGFNVNGQLTLGENIADLGGLTLSYYAYQKALEGKSREKVNGFTPEQRFFIGFAQLWKINYKEAALKQQIATNPHSPGEYRVIGPLANMPEFFAAFDVKEGDAMRMSADEITKIW